MAYLNNTKPVSQLDDNGKVIKKYDCINQAALEHKVSATSIANCIAGRIGKSAGFKWKLQQKKVDEIKKALRSKAKTVSRDNSIGNVENLKNKIQAIDALPTAKQMEQNRSLQGWVYMTKEKTSKQVHPSKIESLINEGWKQSKTIKAN